MHQVSVDKRMNCMHRAITVFALIQHIHVHCWLPSALALWLENKFTSTVEILETLDPQNRKNVKTPKGTCTTDRDSSSILTVHISTIVPEELLQNSAINKYTSLGILYLTT